MPTQSPADGQRSFSSAESSEPVRELKKRLRYTQGVEVDEEELCEMEDRLLQEEIAMTRLNRSSEDTLNEYLDSIIDGQVLLELPLHGQPAGQIGQLTPY